MADFASSDVTVTVEKRSITGKQRRNRVKIAFGDGALTIPSGGVPMPSAQSFGMVRNLEYLTIFDEGSDTGIMWKYDKTNNKLRAWAHNHGLLLANGALAASGAVGKSAGGGLVHAMAATTVTGGSASGGVANTTIAATAYAELTAVAPAAQTLYAEAVGW